MADGQGGTTKKGGKKENDKEESVALGDTPEHSTTPSSSPADKPQDQSSQDNIKWLKDNIKKKERCTFIRDTSNNKECRGECLNTDTTEAKAGNSTINTENGQCFHEVPTDAFGDINFNGLWQKNSKYVRVSTDTKPELLYNLLTKQWGLKPPNVLISVTGGSKYFFLKSHLKKVFYRGIIKMAQTTGTWIITGGTNKGVMRHVGLALRDYALSNTMQDEIVAIGVAPWRVIHNRDKLVKEEGCFPAHYVIDTEGHSGLTYLDNNHTHFLLVDDGRDGRYGGEIELRLKLEEYISGKLHECKNLGKEDVQVVCVVLDGGYGTLHTTYSTIRKGTPCVILQGSGGIADVIAHLHGKRITEDLIVEQMKRFLYDCNDKKTKESTKKIQEILKSGLLTIFSASKEDQHMDVAILQALLKKMKSGKSQDREIWKKQLELAIFWNGADSAETEIFTAESMWKSSDLHYFMKLALFGNKPDFVKLFLENGVILMNFLKEDNTLCKLFQNLPNCFLLKNLAKRMKAPDSIRRLEMNKEEQTKFLDHVSEEVRQLLGKFTDHIRLSPMNGEHTVTIEDKSSKTVQMREDQRLAGRNFFLWAVVQNNKEMAEIAWDQCADCMSAALAASKILKKMAEEENDADKTQQMLELASHYEDRAIGVFNECYKDDEERAQKLLVRVSRFWGGTTCLRLALEADDKNFVAQSGVQDLLTQIWCDELSVNNPVWRVLVCMVFFPLIYTKFLVFSRDERKEPEQKENMEKETSCSRNNLDRSQQESLGCWSRLVGLYCSPQVKFYGNIISYFAFLFLFAYVLMVDFQSTPSIAELVLYFWLFTMVCEEIRQLFDEPDNLGFCEKAKVYIFEQWNILDFISILLFCLGLGLRLTTELFYIGKIILCIDFVSFCLRLMAIFTINQILGPKIIIVKKMMKDLFFFMFLLSIWVVAYGVAKQGILIHNDNRLDWIIRGAIYEPYLTIFGNFPENINNAEFDINSCSVNGTDPLKPKCPVLHENQMPVFPEWLTIIMLCVYLLFANILLINLLIAIFNYTFQEVQDNTDKIWKFQRYELIREYYLSRLFASPPLNIFSYLLFIKNDNNKLKKNLDKDKDEELLSWESLMKDKYMESVEDLKESRENHIQDISRKVTILTEQLRKLKDSEEQVTQRIEDTKPHKELKEIEKKSDNVTTLTEQMEKQPETSSTALLRRLETLEKQVTQSFKSLQWIVDHLQSQGVPAKETQPQSTVE